jgi:cytoskeletal protein CcmA (bactofilin family)
MKKSDRRTWKRMAWALGFAALAALGLVGSAAAAETRGGDVVVVAAGEVIDDDLFLAGNRVEMNGTVKGDLFATGTEVVVNGDVEGSLFVAGQSLEVNGAVGGSLYGGSYAMTVGPEARIARNIYYGGFSLETEPGSAAGRGLYAGGYQLIHAGDIAGDLNFGGAAFELNGSVGGDVHAEVSAPSEPAPTTFMPPFPGSVAPIAPGYRMGAEGRAGGRLDVVETQPVPGRNRTPGERAAASLLRFVADRAGEFIALLIVGAILLRFWPQLMERARSAAQKQPLPSAGYGCLATLAFFIGLPIAVALLIAVTILVAVVTLGQLSGHVAGLGGAGLAVVTSAFFFAAGLVTKAVVALLGGRLIFERLAPATLQGRWGSFWALAVGALIYEILRAIPVFGWLVWVVVVLVGLGAIYTALRERWWPQPMRLAAEPAAPSPPAPTPPAAKRPAARRPAAKKAVAKRPTTRKPGAGRPQ